MTDETTTPASEQSDDDVQAHVMRSGRGPVAEPAETEAHSARVHPRNEDAEAPQKGTEREHGQDDGPDVEGHIARGRF